MRRQFDTHVVSPLSQLSIPHPASFRVFAQACEWLGQSDCTEPESIRADLLPWLKRAVLVARFHEAKRVDEIKASVSDPEVITRLDSNLNVYNEIASQRWFKT